MGFRGGASGAGQGTLFAAPLAEIQIGDNRQSGSANTVARSDHQHRFPFGNFDPSPLGAVAHPGLVADPALSGHVHPHPADDHAPGAFAALTALYDRKSVVDVRDHGAVGDGVADDTAAIQAAINACLNSTGNPATTVRTAIAALFLPVGEYKITAPLDFRSTIYFRMFGSGRNSRLKPVGVLASVLNLDGCAFAEFSDFRIEGNNTEQVTTLISLEWTPGSLRSTTGNVFRTIDVRNTRYVTFFGMGMLAGSAGRQVDNTRCYNLTVDGGYTAGEATWWQDGVRLGTGTFGNNLQHSFFGCTVAKHRTNLYVHAVSPVLWSGGALSDADTDVFFHNNAGTLTVDTIRSEGSTRFLDTAASGGGASSVILRNILYSASSLNADNQAFRFQLSGVLHLDGVRCSGYAAARTPKVWVATQNRASVIADGCASNVAPADFVTVVTPSRTNVTLRNYAQHSDAGSVTKIIGLWIAQKVADGEHGITLGAGNTFDVNLYRSAPDVAKTDDKLHVALDLEVDGALDHDGTLVGLYGKTPTAQAAAIADATGGAIVDPEARAALNALLVAMRNLGAIAT